MTIVDTFLYSEPHEKEVLLIKLHLENKEVSEWIICENEYTFRNEYKGFSLEHLLNSDVRFKPFKNKIRVFKGNIRADVQPNVDDFKIETTQRNFGYDYIMSNYNEDTWIILSDVDEAVDFTGNNRTDKLFYYLQKFKNKNKVIRPAQRRYWYDFDNYAFTFFRLSILPWNLVRYTGNLTSWTNALNVGSIEEHLAFEYTFCYSFDFILRKLTTYSHTGFVTEDIKEALECNFWVRSRGRGESIHSPGFYLQNQDLPHWFETISLDPSKDPAYVIDNLPLLKTHSVPKDYKLNRRQRFPDWFK
jgi:hypothetical protein